VSENTGRHMREMVIELSENKGDYQSFDPWPGKAARVCRVRVDAGIPTMQYDGYVEGGDVCHDQWTYGTNRNAMQFR
jgi:hypothetical protein